MDTANQVTLVLQVVDIVDHPVDIVGHPVDTVGHLVDIPDLSVDIPDQFLLQAILDHFLLLDILVLMLLQGILDLPHLQDILHHLVVMIAEGNMELIVLLLQVDMVLLLPFSPQDLIQLQHLDHTEDILHLHH